MNSKNTIYLFLATLFMVNVASAGILDFNWLFPAAPAQQETPQDDRGAALYIFYTQTIIPLNTPQNIQHLTTYMQSKNVQAVQVHLTDLDKDFYIVSGEGTTLNRPVSIDKSLKLTTGQVKDIAGMLVDGQISYWEQWQLITMLRWLQ